MKTIQELEKLTDDELRVMLAELCGWTNVSTSGNHGVPYGLHPEPSKRSLRAMDDLPNYPADLNVCHEVEESSGMNNYENPIAETYDKALSCVRSLLRPSRSLTARQRTIALIATLQTA